jgi:hypothetical protein
MACKRSAVRSRLAPPDFSLRQSIFRPASPSSRGLGHHPFTVRTGVRIPVGTPLPARLSKAHRKAPQEISGVRKIRPLLRPEIHKLGIATSDGVSRSFLMTYGRCEGSKSFGSYAVSFRAARASQFLKRSEQSERSTSVVHPLGSRHMPSHEIDDLTRRCIRSIRAPAPSPCSPQGPSSEFQPHPLHARRLAAPTSRC